MSFQPPHPVNYYSAPVNPRPTSVTVIAILGIIYGGFITLATPCSIASLFVRIGPPNAIADAIKADKTLVAVQVVANLITWVLGVLLLAGSIGALKLKRWAPGLMMTFAIGSLASTVLGLVLHFLMVQPLMERVFATHPAQAGAMRGIMKLSMIFGTLIALVMPILVLIFMNRRIAKEAFARSGAVPPQDQYYR